MVSVELPKELWHVAWTLLSRLELQWYVQEQNLMTELNQINAAIERANLVNATWKETTEGEQEK